MASSRARPPPGQPGQHVDRRRRPPRGRTSPPTPRRTAARSPRPTGRCSSWADSLTQQARPRRPIFVGARRGPASALPARGPGAPRCRRRRRAAPRRRRRRHPPARAECSKRTHGELAHPGAGGQLAHRGDPVRGLRMGVPPTEGAQRVEDVGVEPDVGVGDPVAARAGVERGCRRPARCGRPTPPPGPARGPPCPPSRGRRAGRPGRRHARGSARRPRARWRARCSSPCSASRPGQERQPVPALGQGDRLREPRGGVVQAPAEQVDPAVHRQRVRLTTGVVDLASRPHRPLEQRRPPAGSCPGRCARTRGSWWPWPAPRATPGRASTASVSQRSARS